MSNASCYLPSSTIADHHLLSRQRAAFRSLGVLGDIQGLISQLKQHFRRKLPMTCMQGDA
jgi:hypothetical protein